MPDDLQLTPEERAAVESFRRENTPKRKATLRGTDPDTGNEWEIELLPEEAAKLAGTAIGKLFGSGEGDKDAGDKGKQPATIQEFFKRQKPAS